MTPRHFAVVLATLLGLLITAAPAVADHTVARAELEKQHQQMRDQARALDGRATSLMVQGRELSPLEQAQIGRYRHMARLLWQGCKVLKGRLDAAGKATSVKVPATEVALIKHIMAQLAELEKKAHDDRPGLPKPTTRRPTKRHPKPSAGHAAMRIRRLELEARMHQLEAKKLALRAEMLKLEMQSAKLELEQMKLRAALERLNRESGDKAPRKRGPRKKDHGEGRAHK